MKRSLLVIAVGLIGLLLGVGLSLVADAVAGNELSDPVPLGFATDHLRSPQRDAPPATASPKHGENDDHAGSGGASGPGGSTETGSSSSPEPTATHSDEGSDAHDGDPSGGSEGSSGDDD